MSSALRPPAEKLEKGGDAEMAEGGSDVEASEAAAGRERGREIERGRRLKGPLYREMG